MIILFWILIGTVIVFTALMPKGAKFESEQRVKAHQDLRNLRK